MRSRLVSETRSLPISRIRSPFGFFSARNSSAEIAGPSFWSVCLTLPKAGLEILLFLALCIIGFILTSNQPASVFHATRGLPGKGWRCRLSHSEDISLDARINHRAILRSAIMKMIFNIRTRRPKRTRPSDTGNGNVRAGTILTSTLIILLLSITSFAQKSVRTIQGVVRIEPSGIAARNTVVTIAELKKSILTDESGAFRFDDVPPGKYQIIAHLDRVPDVVKTVEVTDGNQTVNFQLTLAAVREQVTITATGSAEAVSSSYQAVNSVGALELAQKNPVSIGEALEGQLGVAKRSFGPGSGRPIIRGFDGDRVLVLQDGLRLGGIASQSGDEVEPIDILSLDRVEIVKGPATLLYGSNAIGGVGNGIPTNEVLQKGLSGYLTTFGSTNNWQAGGGAGFKYGVRNLLFFANGGAQKANDYRTPVGTVLNSYARNANFNGVGGGGPTPSLPSFPPLHHPPAFALPLT